METKWCRGCRTEHPLDAFTLNDGIYRVSCREHNNKVTQANKDAKSVKEVWLNKMINVRWRL